MAWAKLDDGFLTHPKALAAGKDGRALFIAGLIYAARELTDGRIAAAALPLVAAAADVRARSTALRLCEVGLWEDHPDGGWVIHDYHDYNPTAEAELAKRKVRADAGRKGGQRSRPRSTPEANTEAKVEANEKQNGTPSPYPYPSNSRQQPTHVGTRRPQPAAAAVDKSHGKPGTTTLEAAIDLLTARRLLAHPTRPGGNAERHRASVRTGIRNERAPDAWAYLAKHPDATPQALADHLEPPPDTRPLAVPVSPWAGGNETARRVDVETEEQTAARLAELRNAAPDSDAAAALAAARAAIRPPPARG